MDRNLHAAFWSDSPSPQENRYTFSLIFQNKSLKMSKDCSHLVEAIGKGIGKGIDNVLNEG
jgi:hypothetical protein